MPRPALTVIMFAAASACGEEPLLVLEIHALCGGAASCVVPADVDGLRLRVAAAADAKELASEAIPLGPADTFPLTTGFAPEVALPRRLIEEVTLTLAAEVVARIVVEHDWDDTLPVNRVTIILPVR